MRRAADGTESRPRTADRHDGRNTRRNAGGREAHRRWLALVACAVLALSSCTIGPSRRPPLALAGGNAPTATTAASTPMPLGPGGPGRAASPLRWGPCPDAFSDTAAGGTVFALRCAPLTVPTSYPEPLRGSVTLQVAEARAAGLAANAPPLVVMPGDPGRWSETDIANIAATLPAEIREHYVIVVMDPRGTGASTGIDCVGENTARAILGMAADPTTAAGGSHLASVARQLMFDCGDAVGPALTKIDSTNAADDLDSLRAALRADRISLLAAGGGATIGAAYADRYPGRVAAMVLDSPADPLATPDATAAAVAGAAQAVVGEFAAACAGFDGGCPLGADPVSAISATVSRLATSGIDAGPWVMTGGSVLFALIELLPDPASWPALAGAIASLEKGDGEPLAELLTAALGGTGLTALLSARMMYACSDTADRLAGAELADAAETALSASPLFGPFAASLAGLCAAWPAPDEALGRLSGAGAAPIVVVGSVNNPRHPFAAARSVARQLATATLVTWQSGRDGGYPMSTCVASVVDDYLLRGTVPERGVLCPP